MAKVIQNFLIGVGLDTKDFDKGQKNVTRGLDQVRKISGLAGTAIVGAFGAAAAKAISAGKEVDSLVLATEKFNTSSQFIYTYGDALRHLQGEASEAAAAIASAESALDEFQIKGSFSAFEDPTLARVDTAALSRAESGEEFLRLLADMMPQLGKAQQRIVQESFGFSDAVMRSLRDGSDHFDALISRSYELGGSIDGASEAAREFNKNLAELGTSMSSVGNILAEKMLPPMGDLLSKITSFISDNKKEVEAAANVISGSVGGAATAAGGGALLAGAGTAGLLGFGGSTTALLGATGAVGLIGGAGMMAMQANPDDIEALTGYRPSDYLFENTPVDLVKDTWDWILGRESGFDRYSSDGRDPISVGDSTVNEFNYGDVISSSGTPEIYVDVAPVVVESKIASEQASRDLIKENRPIKIDNNIELGVKLSGRQFEAEVTDIIERREQLEYEEFQSTTRY